MNNHIPARIVLAVLAVLVLLAAVAQAQMVIYTKVAAKPKNAIIVGLGCGGGGLAGIDYERLLFGPVGLQVGAGLTSFGVQINIHGKKTVTSPGYCLFFHYRDNSLLNRIVGSGFFPSTQRIVGAGVTLPVTGGFRVNLGAGYDIDRFVPQSLLVVNFGGYFKF